MFETYFTLINNIVFLLALIEYKQKTDVVVVGKLFIVCTASRKNIFSKSGNYFQVSRFDARWHYSTN